MPSRTRRPLIRILAFFAVLLGLSLGGPAAPVAHAATPFKVLAFYSGTYDAAHISFEKEANVWFPQQAAANGFTYTSTTNWNQLTSITPDQYQVVMFLDDQPQSQAQFQGFQRYMQAGGGFYGFHVTAYNDDTTPSYANWFHNDFLGTGRFTSNSWGPTPETLKIENRTHPSTVNLPATIKSSTSEWYAWQNDLRQNSNITILASMDQSTFPIGTDPSQTWYSGYYPISWTNKSYKMIYSNFGHNAMNYDTNTALSSTFESADQNRFLLDGLKWLGGGGTTTPPPMRHDRPVGLVRRVEQGERQVRRRAGRGQRQRHRDPAVHLQRHHGAAVPVRPDQRRVRPDQQPDQSGAGHRRRQRGDDRQQPACSCGPTAAATTSSGSRCRKAVVTTTLPSVTPASA